MKTTCVVLAFMAMNLLEFVCRLCKSDEQALLDFSECLNAVEGKYFIHLPTKGFHIKQGGNWFTLPSIFFQHLLARSILTPDMSNKVYNSCMKTKLSKNLYWIKNLWQTRLPTYSAMN